MRCFVAIPLPETVRTDLTGLQEELRQKGIQARWVATHRMHLTLKFLGEVPPETFDQVAKALTPPFEPNCPPPGLGVGGVGAFPRMDRARVLWADVEGDRGPLARLALEVEARLEPLGFPREKRPFRPHLTLGRARDPRGIRGHGPTLETTGTHRGPRFQVDVLHLIESRLGPEGPAYTLRLATPVGRAPAEGR